MEHLSASVVLAAVEESGPNYLLPKAPEPVKSRRKRLRVDATARQAGQAILETGTRVEIFGEEERWWPATIMERTEDTDGRLVHRVQYTPTSRATGTGTCSTTSSGAGWRTRGQR